MKIKMNIQTKIDELIKSGKYKFLEFENRKQFEMFADDIKKICVEFAKSCVLEKEELRCSSGLCESCEDYGDCFVREYILAKNQTIDEINKNIEEAK